MIAGCGRSPTLPANSTGAAADAGVHTFTNAFTLVMPTSGPRGPWIIQATDTQNSNLADEIWLYFLP